MIDNPNSFFQVQVNFFDKKGLNNLRRLNILRPTMIRTIPYQHSLLREI